MNTDKVLYFLDVLAQNTSGKGQVIADLYTRALNGSDAVNTLKSYLNEYDYYRETGQSLYNDGLEMYNKVFADPSNALELMPQIRQMTQKIKNKADSCRDLLMSSEPFMDPVDVIKNKDTIACMRAYRTIAAVCVYLIALYEGPKSIDLLSWNDTAGIQERIYAVNTKFLPALMRVQRPSYWWVIRKKRLGGKALFGGDAFYLSYESPRTVDIMCSGLNKEAIGTHSFLNVRAFELEENDVPYCWGIGNLISVSPDMGLDLLQGNITVDPRCPQGAELEKRLPSPVECLRTLTNGGIYCISPENLLLSMNRWQTGREIEIRKRSHNCLFCGKYQRDGRLVCRSHFTSEL